MPGKLKGIFCPHMIPLHDDQSINEPELRRYVDWLIDHGVHGLYPNGSSGEFLRFTAEERRQIIRIVCEQANHRVPVLAGAAESNARETIRACETYLKYGATAVAIVSPFYYCLGSESVYAYFREIALNSPIDVTLYNIPMFASPIDAPTIQRLAELERITGIKDSSGDVAFMSRMIAAIRPNRPDFSFLCGWEAALVPMLIMGCDGGTNSMSGAMPEFLVDMYRHAVEGDLQQAVAMQLRLLEFFDAVVYSADFPHGLRAAVAARGFNMGASRQPLTEKQQVEQATLQRVLRCIMTDFGYADAPPEGCAPRSGDPADNRVKQLTRSVMNELKRRGVV